MTRWTFKLMLLKTAYGISEMKSMIAQTPFRKAKIDTGDIGLQVWMKK